MKKIGYIYKIVNCHNNYIYIGSTDNVQKRYAYHLYHCYVLNKPKILYDFMRKYNINDIIIFSIILGLLSTTFDFIFFALFYKISPSVLQTNWFIGSILTELVLIFSIRTKLFFLTAKRPSALLSSLALMAIFATVALPYTALGQNLFKFTKPSLNHLLLIFGIVIVYFISTETLKLIFYSKMNDDKPKTKLAIS